MSIVATLGIIGGLAVLALMALGPALVSLNERFPVEDRDTEPADGTRQELRTRRPRLPHHAATR